MFESLNKKMYVIYQFHRYPISAMMTEVTNMASITTNLPVDTTGCVAAEVHGPLSVGELVGHS